MGQSRPCHAEPERKCDLRIVPKQEKTWERSQRKVVREHGHRPVEDPCLSPFDASFELSLQQVLLPFFLVKCYCGRHLLSSMPSRASPSPLSSSASAKDFSVWGPQAARAEPTKKGTLMFAPHGHMLFVFRGHATGLQFLRHRRRRQKDCLITFERGGLQEP